MKHTSLLASTINAFEAGLCPFWWGPPGSGKTELMRQLAARVGRKVLILDLPMIYDPVDTRGIPFLVNGKTVWMPPDYICTNGEPTIIFCDDLPTAPETSQANLFSLILDNRLGGHDLGPNVWRCGAGNRSGDHAATHSMPSPLSTRFAPHFSLSIDLDDVTNYWFSAGVRREVIGFARFKSTLLYPMYNDNTEQEQECGLCGKKIPPGALCGQCARAHRTFPTLRTWTFVSHLLNSNPDPACEYEMYAGTVGQQAAMEFMGYLKMWRQLPSMDALLLSPLSAPIPEEPSVLYSVARELGHRANKDNIDAVVTYANRMPPEFAVLTMRDASLKGRDVTETQSFIGWCAANNNVVL